MKNTRNLLYVYFLLEILFVILFLILNIFFKLDASNVYILLLINLISIFPLPLTNIILDYRNILDKTYNHNYNEISSYYGFLLIIQDIIKMLENKDKNKLNEAIDKITSETRKRILYEEIFAIRPWININSQMSSLFYYTNGIYLNLILVTKNYENIKKELQKEIELFDNTMSTIKFNQTNKKWEESKKQINSRWSDLK